MQYGVIGMEPLKTMSGREMLEGIVAGTYPQPPMAEIMGMRLSSVGDGTATFEGTPALQHYNPLGTVHGGFAATLLDSCMACAVQTQLAVGVGYTTIEFKVTLVRPITVDTGPVLATGTVVNVGRRVGVADGKLTDQAGKILAHGTTSCLIFPL